MSRHIAILDPSAFTIPYDDHLCRGLAEAGCEVTFFTRPVRQADYFRRTEESESTGSSYQTCEHFYRTTERLPWISASSLRRKGLKVIEHTWNMATVCRKLRRLQPDVIHFQWTVVPAIDCHFLKRLQTIAPCLLTVHDTNAFLAPTSRLQKAGWLSILRQFDRLIVHTQAGRQALVAKGIDERRIAVIPHGVFDCPQADDMPAAAAPSDRCVLLAFGSIKPYKGVDILIRALTQLPGDLRRNVQLIIAGNPGGLEAELRRLAGEVGVTDSIEWKLGFVPDQEIPGLFARSHAAVFPYREIDASGALMTALPYGKAIIASRLGLFAELLEDGETAHLVEPQDPAALANAIAKVANDLSAAQQMGRRAAALARDVLSWGNIARLTLEAYEAARSH